MTTTAETTAKITEPPDPASLPEVETEAITVRTHDGARMVAWTMAGSGWVGLTPKGIAAAARATGDFIDSLSASEQRAMDSAPGLTQVRIAVHEWLIPLIPGRVDDIAQAMLDVVRTPGVLGRVS